MMRALIGKLQYSIRPVGRRPNGLILFSADQIDSNDLSHLLE